MDKDELLELAERVEALTGPDREVDAAIYQALNPHMTPVPEQVGRFYDATRTNARIAGKYYLASGATGAAERWTGSIDAASDLVPERYKRHITMVISPASIDMGRRDYQAYLGGHARKGRAQSFALALTAAALRARAAQQPSGAMTGE